MKKYEEEKYRIENIQGKIYPWITGTLSDRHALNGKYISQKDTPLIDFVGELMVVLVIRRGEDAYEILKDNMLPPDCDVEALYHTACGNLARDVEFVVSNTWYGGFGIIADGYHEASSLCFKHIWSMCAEKLEDDLVIMVPSKDMVLFAPAGQQDIVDKMKDFGNEAYERSQDKISRQMFVFTKEGKALLAYEEIQH